MARNLNIELKLFAYFSGELSLFSSWMANKTNKPEKFVSFSNFKIKGRLYNWLCKTIVFENSKSYCLKQHTFKNAPHHSLDSFVFWVFSMLEQFFKG